MSDGLNDTKTGSLDRESATLSGTVPAHLRSMINGTGIYRFHMKADDTVHDGVIFQDQYGVFYYQLVDAGVNSNKWDKVTSVSKQMMPHEYMETVRKRISQKNPFNDGPFKSNFGQIVHGILGAAEEAMEVVGKLRKMMFYDGHDEKLDIPNILEEAGDAAFFWSAVLDAVGLTWNDVFYANDKKLALRHGNKFNEKNLETRDIAAERASLEADANLSKDKIANFLSKPNPKYDAEALKKEFPLPTDDEAIDNPISTVVLPKGSEVTSNSLPPEKTAYKGGISYRCGCPTKLAEFEALGSDGGHIQPPNKAWPEDLSPDQQRAIPAAQRFDINQIVVHRLTKDTMVCLNVCKCSASKNTRWETWGLDIPLADITGYGGAAPCERLIKVGTPTGTQWVDSQYLDKKPE